VKILNNVLTLLIVLGVAYLGLMSHCRGQENEALRQEIADLQGNVEVINGQVVQIPRLAKAVIAYEGDMLTIVERIDSLSHSVESIYIPPEGSYELVFVEDTVAMAEIIQNFQLLSQLMSTDPGDTTAIQNIQSTLDSLYLNLYKVDADIQTSGLTFSPMVWGGVGLDAEAQVGAGARVYYNGHWGGGLDFGLDFPEPQDTVEILEDVSLHAYVDYRGLFGLRNLGLGLDFGRGFIQKQWEVGGKLNFYFGD